MRNINKLDGAYIHSEEKLGGDFK